MERRDGSGIKNEFSRKMDLILREKWKGLEITVNALKVRIMRIITCSFVIEFFADEFYCAHLVHFIGIPGVAVVVDSVKATDLIPSKERNTFLISAVDKWFYDSDCSIIGKFNNFTISYGITNSCNQIISPLILFYIIGMLLCIL